jgi:hypothetical protein
MDVRSVPLIVLDEAVDVLGELEDWQWHAGVCPKCDAPSARVHRAGCPLGRVARLYRLLTFHDPQQCNDDLAALRRERGEPTSEGCRPLPASSGPMVTSAGVALDLPEPTSPIEAGAPTVRDEGAAPLACTLGDAASGGGHLESGAPGHGEARELARDAPAQVDAVDDERARAFVVETLQLAATQCFAEAKVMRGRADRAPAGPILAHAAAMCDRAGRYAEAAARWLTRNGAVALLGQGTLLGALVRDTDQPGLERSTA